MRAIKIRRERDIAKCFSFVEIARLFLKQMTDISCVAFSSLFLPSLEEINIVELVQLDDDFDGGLELAAHVEVVAVGVDLNSISSSLARRDTFLALFSWSFSLSRPQKAEEKRPRSLGTIPY